MDGDRARKLLVYGIDYETGVDRFAGNAAMYEKFILRFLDETHFEELQEAFVAGNVEECVRIAHSLKGVAGNLSFSDYYIAVAAVEDALHEQGIDDRTEELMRLVTDSHKKVIRGLQTL